jgi:hypothetical protein
MMHAFKSGVLRMIAKCFIDGMGLKQKEQLDSFLTTTLSKQRCHSMLAGLRTNFSKGITNCTLLGANEWPGLLLAYLIVGRTYRGGKILDARFDDDDAVFEKRAEKRRAMLEEKEWRANG